LVVWLLMSLAAMAGKYSLWWQREKRLYLGKDITQQRIAVFKQREIIVVDDASTDRSPEMLDTIAKYDKAHPCD